MDNSTGPQQSQLQGPQHFRRVLSRRDLVLYGLVILTPTAPYPVFGIVQQLSGGHAALAYVVAMVAMFFTAASYGKMAAVFPSAGSTYTYAQKGLNPHAGFLAGWAMILDYFLIPLLSVIYASLTAERLLPLVPSFIWAVIFTFAITAVNLRGIRMTARASAWLMAIMTGCAALFTVRGILVMGAVALIGSLTFRFQLAVELLNFGALTGFILVNLSVVNHYYIRERLRSGWQAIEYLVFPLLGTLVCSFLWFNLTAKAKLAGFGWLALGIIYLSILTRGFRLAPKTLASLEEASSNAG